MTVSSSHTERNFLIDLAKAVAMLLVVVQHSWSMLNLDTPEHGLLCYAYRAIVNCGVPFFVLISGALILPKTIEPLKVFYRKRLPRLLLPWLVWATLVYVLSLFTGAYPWFDGHVSTAVWNFIPCLLNNDINEFHWFVHMIFALYLLAPFLQRALQHLSSREVLGVLIVWAAVLGLMQLRPCIYLFHYVSPLWRYLGVFIAGYYLRTATLPQSSQWMGLAAVLSLYLLDVLTSCQIALIEPLTAIALGLWLMNAGRAENMPKPLRTFTTNVSRYSYTIYLVHIPIIRMLYTVDSRALDMLAAVQPVLPLLVALIVLTIIYLACLAYDKIRPLPNILVGIG